MAEAGGLIGCCLLLGCCGACFACGRGCKSDSSTQVREPAQQPTRIVVVPVAVSPVAAYSSATSPAALPSTPTTLSVPAGYLVMTDPVTGQQQIYAPVAPATPTAPVVAEPSTLETQVMTSTHDELKTPLLKD